MRSIWGSAARAGWRINRNGAAYCSAFSAPGRLAGFCCRSRSIESVAGGVDGIEGHIWAKRSIGAVCCGFSRIGVDVRVTGGHLPVRAPEQYRNAALRDHYGGEPAYYAERHLERDRHDGGVCRVDLADGILFLGRDVLGDTGSILFPLLWIGVLLYIFRWISRHTVVVPEDHAIMVARFYSGSLYRLQPPLAPPLIPLLERRVATIPLYELSHDVKVAKINTGGSHSIDEVEVHLRYRVKNPEFALANIPNRGQIQNEVAREMGRDLEQARLDVAFWEKLLARQLTHEVDDIVREVIFAETKSATDAYQKRLHISREVFRRLNELTKRWGVVVSRVDIDYFSVPEDRFRSPDPDGPVKQEVKRILETSKAEAQAEAERIRHIVRVLREEGIEIAPEIIGALLIPEWTGEIEPLLPPPAAKPLSDGPGNGGAKPGNATKQ